MSAWKLPPKAKIYEAMSAVADGRVDLIGDNMAEVVSSSGRKTYTVEWSGDISHIASNDNASYWQGYMGYPILAVLMFLGKLSYKKEVAGFFAGIPWKKINTQFKRDYDKAVESVLLSLQEKGADAAAIRNEADSLMLQIEQLCLQKLPRRKRPPKE
jgi:hypothetical protein